MHKNDYYVTALASAEAVFSRKKHIETKKK